MLVCASSNLCTVLFSSHHVLFSLAATLFKKIKWKMCENLNQNRVSLVKYFICEWNPEFVCLCIAVPTGHWQMLDHNCDDDSDDDNSGVLLVMMMMMMMAVVYHCFHRSADIRS